jgi:predicted XRE-type DNA-binding protein
MENLSIGSSFDDFLNDEGIAEDVETGSIKKLIAYQMQEMIENNNLSKTELAQRLNTSRAAVNRLLDPYNESVTLFTLKKSAKILGKKLKLELI